MKTKTIEEQLVEARKQLKLADEFIARTAGTCLGLAMSGANHPNPDEKLMELFEDGNALIQSKPFLAALANATT